MPDKYFPVSLKKIVVDTIPDFDLFIRQGEKYILYRQANIRFESKHLQNLLDNRIESLYVDNKDMQRYKEYRERIVGEHAEEMKQKGYGGRFVDPVEVDRYHEIYDNYHVIDRELFRTGMSVDFTVYYHRDNDLFAAEDFAGKPAGPWELTRPFASGQELMIRNEDLPKYREYVESMVKDASNVEARAAALREVSKMVVKDVLDDPRSGEGIKQATGHVSDMVGFILENDTSFYSLMKISGHDYYTYVHSMNVCTFSVALGQTIGLKESPDLEWLGLGAMLHDIGKSMVDPKLINKPGRLTEEEFQKMKDHVLLGVNTLKENHDLPEKVLEPVAQHHEKMTGIGYPYGHEGEKIGLFGRISSIVDIYDALTTERSYKKALSPFEALSFLSKTQKDYDDTILTQFILMLGKQIEQEARAGG